MLRPARIRAGRKVLRAGQPRGTVPPVADRRDSFSYVDLAWAVFGPILMVVFAWSLLGETIGMVAVLVMLPFLVVGVRDVVSGRAAERNAQRREKRG